MSLEALKESPYSNVRFCLKAGSGKRLQAGGFGRASLILQFSFRPAFQVIAVNVTQTSDGKCREHERDASQQACPEIHGGPLNYANVTVHHHLTIPWHNPHVVQCAGRVEALGGRSMRMAMNCENVQNLARCCV